MNSTLRNPASEAKYVYMYVVGYVRTYVRTYVHIQRVLLIRLCTYVRIPRPLKSPLSYNTSHVPYLLYWVDLSAPKVYTYFCVSLRVQMHIRTYVVRTSQNMIFPPLHSQLQSLLFLAAECCAVLAGLIFVLLLVTTLLLLLLYKSQVPLLLVLPTQLQEVLYITLVTVATLCEVRQGRRGEGGGEGRIKEEKGGRAGEGREVCPLGPVYLGTGIQRSTTCVCA